MADQKDLTALVQRRDKLRENIQRVKGRLDRSREELTEINDECKRKKVDPEKIDDVIAQLTQRLDSEVQKLTDEIRQTEEKVAPFLDAAGTASNNLL